METTIPIPMLVVFWDDFGHEDDDFFGMVYNTCFENAAMAFPNWTKSSLPSSAPRWHNWSFRWGSNHHQGLDWVKRSLGGWKWEAKLYDQDEYSPRGTFHWFEDDLDYHSSSAKDLLIFAHHPLTSSQMYYFFDQFQPSERNKIVNAIDEEFDPIKAQWFSGHVHPKDFWFIMNPRPSERWYVGEGTGSNRDTVVEVHLLPGIYGKEDIDESWGGKQYYVGLVHVYGKYKCDFSYNHPSSHPDFPNVGDPVTFTDESECFYGCSGTDHYWRFGDNYGSYSPGPVTHTYKYVRKYYAKLAVTFGDQITHSSKPVLAGFQYPQWHSIRFRKHTSASSLCVHLPSTGSSYYAVLRWGSKGYIGWKFKNYEAYRQILGGSTIKIPKPPKTNNSTLQAEVKDDGPFYSGQQVRFQILAKWQDHHYTELGESPKPIEDFWGRDTVVQVPGDPDPPPSCPELYTCIDYDSTFGEFEFVANNTVLAHSLTNPAIAKDLLLLEWPLYEYQGFTAITLMERNTETSVFDGIKLHVVDHPKGTGIVTSSDSNVYCVKNVIEPWACFDAFENDYLYNVLPHTGSENSLKAVAGQEIFVKFDFPCWGDGLGLLMSSGLEPEEEYLDPKRNKVCAFQEDTSGNWTPIGEAYTRGYPSEWLIKAVEDTGAAMLPSFKLQFAGEDTACINYIMLVSLVDSGWTDTTISPTTALHWYQVGGQGGEWQSSNETAKLLSVDDSTCVLSPSEQLAVVFAEVRANPDTSMVRDYVLESYGVYFSEAIPPGSPGVEEKEPVFTFAFNVKQVRPFSRTVTISYQVPRSIHVSLVLYDASGRLVKSFVDEEITPGKYSISWDGTDSKSAKVSSGAYFVRIKAGSFLKTQKLVILE